MGDRGGVGGGNKLLSVEIGREGDVEETKFWYPPPLFITVNWACLDPTSLRVLGSPRDPSSPSNLYGR